jgi:hypothetical protein
VEDQDLHTIKFGTALKPDKTNQTLFLPITCIKPICLTWALLYIQVYIYTCECVSFIIITKIPLKSRKDSKNSFIYFMLILRIYNILKFNNYSLHLSPQMVSSRDNSVSIVTGKWLDGQGVGVRIPIGSRIFSSPRFPDRFWGPSSLLSNVYRRHFPRG